MPNEQRQRRANAYEVSLLDEIDRRVLEELGADGRLTMAELGRRVNLSPPAVAERVQRLERSGVITGYKAVIDSKAIGYPLAAVVRVRPASRQLQRIPEIARTRPRWSSATGSPARTASSSSCTSARSTTSRRSSTASSTYGQTTTSIIHSTPVASRQLPLVDQ